MKTKYEIVNHGYEHAQYFQGQGTTFTGWDSVVTGFGMNAVEAYNDAVEQVYQTDDNADKLKLPKKPRGYGITLRDAVPSELADSDDNEFYWYVSILW